MKSRSGHRRAFAFAETVVASVLFGIMLTGIGATMGAQEKLMRAIELRMYVMTPANHGVKLTRQAIQDPPDPFWPVARVDTGEEPGADPMHGLTTESLAYQMMARNDLNVALGPVPRVLDVADRRPERWPEGEPPSRSILPPRIERLSDEPQLPGVSINANLTIQDAETDPATGSVIVTVDWAERS
jgi:hypothetical protein